MNNAIISAFVVLFYGAGGSLIIILSVLVIIFGVPAFIFFYISSKVSSGIEKLKSKSGDKHEKPK